MRHAFIKALSEAAEMNPNIMLLTGDLGFSVFENFIEKFPKQYVNMGVSESNMIGVAAGLALSGKMVFAYSIVPFATMRPFEQIRNDICMQNANVRIVGVGGGLSYGELGPTHHSIQDVAVMRTLPHMAVLVPGDPVEVYEATRASVVHRGPMYIRLAKKGEPIIHTDGIDFSIGKIFEVRKGSDVTLLVSGHLLPIVCKVSDELTKKGISARVISVPTIKPLNIEEIQKSMSDVRAVCTLEEHSIIGGLGSAVAEIIAEGSIKIPFKRFGIIDTDTKIVGSHEYLREVHRLSAPQLLEDISLFLKSV